MKKLGLMICLLMLFCFVFTAYGEYYLETWYKIKVYGKKANTWKYHVFNVQKNTAVKAIKYILKKAKSSGWSYIRVERLERYVKQIGRIGRPGFEEEAEPTR